MCRATHQQCPSFASFEFALVIPMSPFQPIPRAFGFKDLVGVELETEDAAINRAREVLSARGYAPIRTPILESSELFLRKSGGVLASQMYEFVSPDGANLSLRPEMTAPVIRHALETQTDASLPKRYQYAGPVFRYPDGSDGRSATEDGVPRQFTQVGAELIGANGPESDGEVIAAAVEVARAVGLPDIVMVLSDVGLVRRLLNQFALPNRAHLFFMRNLAQLAMDGGGDDVRQTAAEMNLTPSNGATSALEAMERLARIRGETGYALEAVEDLCEVNGLSGVETVAPLRNIVDAAVGAGVDRSDLAVDFGLDVGIEYYTNTVWGIYARTGTQSREQVGGGGRYDALAKALGSPVDVPALGFAINLDDALAVLS